MSPSPVDPDRLARITDELRALRARLADPADAFVWEIDLYTYDQVLVTAADLLDVPLPANAREEMGSGERRQLEEALAAAGVDVSDGEGSDLLDGQPDAPLPPGEA